MLFNVTAIRTNAQLPADACLINVKKFGAKGDGLHDDTKAIKAAFASQGDKQFQFAWEHIYFPAGTYLITDQINWMAFTTVRGDGPSKTFIKLKNNTPGYQDTAKPKPVLFCRRNGTTKAHDNVSHNNFIRDLSVIIDDGNKGAVGIDYSSHNGGCIENVHIIAVKGSGYKGISMDRPGPGPAMIDNVSISGFDIGISISTNAYVMTFENITLMEQRVCGVRNNGNCPVIRKLHSFNQVTAIENIGGRATGLFVLIDSKLEGGNAEYAIKSDGELFLRNVTTFGYKKNLLDGNRSVENNYVAEYSSSKILSVPNKTDPGTLNLNVKDAPDLPLDSNTANWVSINKYQSLIRDGDWAYAIQAAIDEGKNTVYFPNIKHGAYKMSKPIYVRGPLKRILGYSARCASKFIFQTDSAVVIDQLALEGGVEIIGKGAVVLNHCIAANIKTSPGCGDLFLNDYCCGNIEIDHSNLYARQLNEESIIPGPKLKNNGGTIWVLGYKTEQGNEAANTFNNGSTEIIGGFIYPAQGIKSKTMYTVNNASFSAIHREMGPKYPVFINLNGKEINPPFPFGVRFSLKK